MVIPIYKLLPESKFWQMTFLFVIFYNLQYFNWLGFSEHYVYMTEKAHKKSKQPVEEEYVPVAMEVPETMPSFLPVFYQNDLNGPHFIEYANKFITPAQVGGGFRKISLSIEDTIKFSADHTIAPLITNTPPKFSKDSIMVQKAVLKLTGSRESKQYKGDVFDFLEMLKKDPTLVDEAYVVFVRQTTEAKAETLIPTIKIFTTLASFYRPSDDLCPYVRAHVARLVSANPSGEIHDRVTFLYIRLCARIASHVNKGYTKDTALAAENDMEHDTIKFEVSLEEMMWHQRKKHPRLPIPHVFYTMTERFIELNAETTVGIFRLPGSMGKVNKCPAEANLGNDYLKGMALNDIGTLLKKWFRDIDGNVIPEEIAKQEIYCPGTVNSACRSADRLPDLTKWTVAYLVGFLRRLSLSSQVTQMGVPNLAMTFALNMTYVDEDDHLKATETASYVQSFLERLIERWDVSAIYPLPEGRV